MVNAASPIEFSTPTRTVAGSGALGLAGAAAVGAAVGAAAAAPLWPVGLGGAAGLAAGGDAQAAHSASTIPHPTSTGRPIDLTTATLPSWPAPRPTRSCLTVRRAAPRSHCRRA